MQVHTDWLLTPQRVAVHLPTGTAVASDLHLGYAQVRQRSGEAVPVPFLDEELVHLGQVVRLHGTRRLVIAGDLFEDGRLAEELEAPLRRWLKKTCLELVGLVPGNHDRGLDAKDWPLAPEGFDLGGWRVAHGDGPLPAGPVVQGHVHPCVRLRGMSAPCYLVGPQRLVLPAFSRDAAGVNVLRQRPWGPYRCCVIAGDGVLDFGPVSTLRGK